MAVSKELSRFTRDALLAGKSRNEIAKVLAASGWSTSEVKDALSAWAETPFATPVPKPQGTVSARDFFFYTLMFGLMAFGTGYLIHVLLILIDGLFDDQPLMLHTIEDMRLSIAVLIVVVPMFLWLSLRDRRALAADSALYRSAIRRWLTYLTLLVSAIILLIDLIVVIDLLLNGALVLQFILNAAVVGGIAALIFGYYLLDIRKGDAA